MHDLPGQPVLESHHLCCEEFLLKEGRFRLGIKLEIVAAY